MALESLDTMCRICLDFRATYPIFTNMKIENGENLEESLLSKLTKCVHEEIKDREGYPRNICLKCKSTLDVVSEFIELYKKSDKMLRDQVSLVKTEIPCSFSDTENDNGNDSTSDRFMRLEDIKFESDDDDKSEPIKKLLSLNIPGLNVKVRKENQEIDLKYPNDTKKGKNKGTKVNRVASSLLEGKFTWFDQQWCLNKKKSGSNCNAQNKQQKAQKASINKRTSVKPVVLPKLPTKPKPNPSKLCDLCGQVFADQNKLWNHQKIKHSDMPSLQCPGCDKKFNIQYNLNKHFKRMHSDDKNFICDQCSKSFAYHYDLQVHMKTVHLKIKCIKKRVQCDYCEKTFVANKFKIMHERSVHTGLRPAQCTYCDAAFTHNDYLKEHVRLHTGETPYKCPICGRGYAQRCNMKSHLRIHRISELTETMLSKMKPSLLKRLKKV